RRDDAALYNAQYIKDVDGEHGRIVEREYRALPVSEWIKDIDSWQDIQSVIEVIRTREGKTAEVSHYISSLATNVQELSRTIRHHWAIENSQHWVLDVTFREDESQIYAEDGAKNLALFRRALLNLIKAHPMKDSVAGKRQRAYWDDKFRAEILFG
ncbi:MAG: ISAs1 family transposase, partial [Alishewanella aestuarii]